MNPLPDVTKAYSSIVQEEKQRSLGAARETTENSAMVVQRTEPVGLFNMDKVLLLIPTCLIENLSIALIVTMAIMCGKHAGS